MYKLTLGLGWNAVRVKVLPPYKFHSDYAGLPQVIDGHRIVLSDKIREYYIRRAAQEGLEDLMQEFLMNIMQFDDQCIEISDADGNKLAMTFINAISANSIIIIRL